MKNVLIVIVIFINWYVWLILPGMTQFTVVLENKSSAAPVKMKARPSPKPSVTTPSLDLNKAIKDSRMILSAHLLGNKFGEAMNYNIFVFHEHGRFYATIFNERSMSDFSFHEFAGEATLRHEKFPLLKADKESMFNGNMSGELQDSFETISLDPLKETINLTDSSGKTLSGTFLLHKSPLEKKYISQMNFPDKVPATIKFDTNGAEVLYRHGVGNCKMPARSFPLADGIVLLVAGTNKTHAQCAENFILKLNTKANTAFYFDTYYPTGINIQEMKLD